MWKRLRVKYPLFLSAFNETWVFSTDFRKKVWDIKFHQNPSSGSRVIPCGRTDRRRDGRADMTKFTSLFAVLWTRLKIYCELACIANGTSDTTIRKFFAKCPVIDSVTFVSTHTARIKHEDICFATPVTKYTNSFRSRYSCLFLRDWLFSRHRALRVDFQFISLNYGLSFSSRNNVQSTQRSQCDTLYPVSCRVSRTLL
jgi:hypothetical protein